MTNLKIHRKQTLVITIFSATKPLFDQREVVSGLLDLLRRHDMVATWAVDNESIDALAMDLTSTGHDRAIHGTEDWTQGTAGRACFVREFNRSITEFQAFGFQPSTLVLPHPHPFIYLDLLAKQGITSVVRTINLNGYRGLRTQPALLRWGLWEVSHACCIPAPGVGWLGDNGARSAIRMMARGSVSHLAIDVEAFGSIRHAARRSLERVLQSAARRRDANLLENRTVATLVSEQILGRRSSSTRSILRRAA